MTALGRALTAAILAASVLAVDPGGAFAFGPLRWMAVSTLSILLVAIGLCQKAFPRADSKSGQPSEVHIIGALLICWLAVAAFAGREDLYAWVGTPDRRLGMLSFVMFAALFTAGTRAPARWIAALLSVCAAFIALWTVAEWIDMAPVDVGFADDRLGGPYGQPAYLGAACALAGPIAVGVAISARQRSVWWTWPVSVVPVGALLALALSQTRGAWVGAATAIAFAIAATTPWRNRRPPASQGKASTDKASTDKASTDKASTDKASTDKASTDKATPDIWLQGRPLLGAVLMGAVLMSIAAVAFATRLGERALSIFDFTGDGVSGRLDEWHLGVQVIADHPLTGVGPEGYRTVVGSAIDAGYALDYGRDVLPDRAHNALLDLGAVGGVAAIVFTLLLYGLLLRASWRAARSGDPLLVGLGAGCTAYIVQLQFLFHTFEVDPLFWVAAGAVVAAERNASDAAATTTTKIATPTRRAATAVAALATATLSIWVLATGWDQVRSDRNLSDAIDDVAKGEADAALGHATEAVDRDSNSIRNRFFLAGLLRGQGTRDGLNAALEQYSEGLRISSHDPALNEARASATLALARVSDDGAMLALAIEQLGKLVDHDPNNPATRLEMGTAFALDANLEAAIGEFEHAAALAPESPVPFANLIRAHQLAGNADAASSVLDRALAQFPFDQAIRALAEGAGEAGG